MTQREFGTALGASHRSATRWEARQSVPGDASLRKLAGLLAPVDAALAAEAAAHLGETLMGLGLVAPPEPPAPPIPVAPPAPPPTPAQDLVDVIVCAAADAMDAAPRVVRPVLHAAFRRARQLGLTVEQVERALAPTAPATRKNAEPRRADG
jgi:transcriptional regulator with XRE-family HTH domain